MKLAAKVAVGFTGGAISALLFDWSPFSLWQITVAVTPICLAAYIVGAVK